MPRGDQQQQRERPEQVIHHHHEVTITDNRSGGDSPKLDELLRQNGFIITTLEALVAQSAELTAFIGRLNTATNTLAARVEALKAKITQGGMSETEEKAGIAEADAIVATLESIGADPVDPLPAPEPPVVP